ncbi:hypothetical protein QCA50_019178 [Cerrena zonata]|uniref:Uncharacterized protein n=1 Tax=Cerrena zonata TaxID=2478898 RepID=A0AAW0FKJ1_9APHY
MSSDTIGGLLSPSTDTDITEAQDSVKSQIVEPLSIISDVFVHNLTRSKKGVDPIPVKRSITFLGYVTLSPGKRWWPHDSWAPAPIPEGKILLEIELGEPDQHRTHWTRPCCTYNPSP